MLAVLPVNQISRMERKVEIIHNPGTDGIAVCVDGYNFTISGTEWATRRADSNFDLSSPNVSYTLTAEDIAEIERYL